MVSKSDRRYVGKAWGSLATTKNLFGKLLLLALLQFIPIVGQIALLGCALGWAREAAWKMDTPLPDHVLGRGETGFWARGAKAFLAIILFQIILSAVVALLNYIPLGLASWVDLEGDPLIVTMVVCVVLSILAMIFLSLAFTAGLVRLAIYNRFGAAFQFGVCLQMVFRHFGGLLKILIAFFLLSLVASIPVIVCVIVAVPGFFAAFGPVVTLNLAFGPSFLSVDPEIVSLLSGDSALGCSLVTVALVVALLLFQAISVMLELLEWRAIGNWVATFDVARWGGRFDKLPSQKSVAVPADGAEPGSAESAEGSPVEGVEISVPAPVKRSHPVLLWILSSVVAVAVCAAASWYAVSTFSEHQDEVGFDDITNVASDLADALSDAFEGTPYGRYVDDFLKDAGLSSGGSSNHSAPSVVPARTVEA